MRLCGDGAQATVLLPHPNECPSKHPFFPALLPRVEADTTDAARTIASIEATAIPEPNSEAQAENRPMEWPEPANLLTARMMQQ